MAPKNPKPAAKTEPLLPSLPGIPAREEPTSKSLALAADAPVPKADYLPPGYVVNGYAIQDKLGKGAFGAVYLARREGDFYALKFPLVSVEELSQTEREETLGRLQREIGTLLQLNHPVVVNVIESFRWPSIKTGLPVMAMPYIDGLPLRKFCRAATPSLADILGKLLRPLAEGLAYLHAKGIVHRDIKSGNILVTSRWEVKLLDFGIARSRAAATMTRQAVLMGTYTHMPPEVFRHFKTGAADRGEPMPYTPKADLYALGVVIYEAITGAIPRWYLSSHVDKSDEAGIPGEWIDGLLKTPLDLPSRVNPALPPQVDGLLSRLLATDPTERYESGAEVARDVTQLLEEHGADQAWTSPLSVPARPQEPPSSGARAGASTRNGRSPGSNPMRQDSGRLPPPPPDSALRADISFKAPADAPPSFRAPLQEADAASAVSAKQPELPSAVRQLAGKLKAPDTAASNRRLLFVGGAVVSLLALGSVALKASSSAPKPRSLLAEPEAPMPKPAQSSPASSATAAGPDPLSPPAAAPAVAPAGAHLVVDDLPPAPLPLSPTSPASARPQPAGQRRSAAPSSKNPDAKAVDELLAKEYGGQRPVLPADPAAAPAAPAPKSNTPSWLKTARAVGGEVESHRGPLGIAMGTEIPLRLAKPLDSRTVGSGPVVAKLSRAFAPRGEVLLATGTMVYGTAQASGDRFQVRFTSLKLPDGTEVPLEGLAYDLQDHKPGLKASGRVSNTNGGGPSLAAKVATGTAGAVLSRVGGQDDATAVAKQAGQTILTGAGDQGSNGGAAEALLLDAPCDFSLFVSKAF